MKNSKTIWLKEAYAQFARYGRDSLKVDSLASLVGKSRSSFYHLFGDMEEFMHDLLDYHWERSKIFAEELKTIDTFYPGFAKLLEKNKDWAFFHINCSMQRDKDNYCARQFQKVTELIENNITLLWARTIGLDSLPVAKTRELYRVMREIIFARMDYDTYSAEFLDQEMKQLNDSIRFMLKDHLHPN